jgi:hypothetical protein
MWIDPKEQVPEVGLPVRALLKGATTGKLVESVLVHVDESDCFWRTADDNSEVDFNWDVIGWKALSSGNDS